MDNQSILDQIITNQKAEQVANLDAAEIVNNIFSKLGERERKVLISRFGLHGQGRETLEKIGREHNLTRERIRQIETYSIKKLRQLKELEDCVKDLRGVISQLLEEHGGLMEKKYLLDNLVNFSVSGAKSSVKDKDAHKNYLDFLISQLLRDEFEEIGASDILKPSFKLKYQALDHLEALAEELLDKIKQAKKVFLTDELIEFVKGFESYKKHEEKLQVPNTLDISKALAGEFFSENSELINSHKALYSLLRAAKKIEQNKFGHWGAHDWREIKPKTINDKIYLVLKNHGKPMHFADIADKINQLGFDRKQANAATVHNELILDDKYILVGRGLYGLKEWGFQKGTVADVISKILTEEGALLSRDAIINKVLEKRLVKKATVVLALMDKERFEKVDGKYKIQAVSDK